MQQTSDKVMKGNSVPMNNTVTNTQPIGEFAGFRPEALQRIANTVGYTGDMNGFDAYLSQNPEAQQRMQYYTEAARKMARGGMVKKYATGGAATSPNPPNYQAFLNSPQYQQAQSQASAQVLTPVTIGGQTYNFGNPVLAQAYQNFAASQQNATTTTATPTAQPTTTKTMPTALSQQYIPQQNFATGATLPEVQAQIATTPGLPAGATMVPAGVTLEQGQLVSPASGQVAGTVAVPTAQALTSTATAPQAMQAAQAQVQQVAPEVSNTLQTLQAAQGTVDPRAEILAAQQTATSVGNVQAAQGNAILINNPVQRQIEAGELVSGAADAATASAFAEQIQAATATPSKQATVQGQLETLMAQFDNGKTPAWAAGSMRNAMATLSARGLGASSMAGQAVIQAAMEAALPIAQADANVMASFEAQNLSNRQQRAMLAAQQRAQFIGQEFDQAFQARVANAARIGDIANMNFTAEQQIALENSRIANTVNMQNLTNRQAMVMAEASALANLDMANLSNRQQAAVQNAQSFLQMDMANLTNEQQTAMFKAQSNLQALFTDQAAQNATEQFNASSENQTNQFFANLQAQVSQFNTAQQNAISQFNADEANALEQFNAEIAQQRQLFNTQNSLIIAQANAKWRQDIDTVNTAAQNAANADLAATLNALSAASVDQIWQRERDLMAYAFQASESALDREVSIIIGDKSLESVRDQIASDESQAKNALRTYFALQAFGSGNSDSGGGFLGRLF